MENISSLDDGTAIKLKRIGEVLVKARSYRRFQQKQVASKLKVSASTLSEWEHGKSNITMASLIRLCDALGMKLEVHITASSSCSQQFYERA